MKFKKGQKVVMHTCGEADHYNGKIWECETDSYISKSKDEVVFLVGFSGCFLCNYLQLVDLCDSQKKDICPKCNGFGYTNPISGGQRRCKTCNATGQI